jgi:Zn-dependent protease
MANYFGDDTPRRNGRLTLNPMAHLDLMGSLMLVFAGFGWAKPVPVNLYALERRSQWAPLWVALAGPLSNLLMALLISIPFQIGIVSASQAYLSMATSSKHILPTLSQVLYVFVSTNILLMLFNLIPLSPLDGEKILYYLLPASGQRVMDQIRPYSPIILLVLVFGGMFLGFNLLGQIITPAMNAIMGVLVG